MNARRRSIGNIIRDQPAALVVAVAILSLLLVAVSIRACGGLRDETSAELSGETHTYQWENLSEVDGRFNYMENGFNIACTGIDVSEHQGYIDWNRVAQDGIEFAMVRLGNRGATSGFLSEDDYVFANLDGAANAGIEVGAYFFSQAINEDEAIEEAEFALNILDGRKLSLPVVFDHEPVSGVEGRADGLSNDQLTAIAQAFCDRIRKAGYDVMIYGNAGDLSRYDLSSIQPVSVWYAEYGVDKPGKNTGFSMWQYSNTGKISGIDVDVDMNVLFNPHM